MKYHAFFEHNRRGYRSKLVATVDSFEEAKTQCEKHASDYFGPIGSEESKVDIQWADLKQGQAQGRPQLTIEGNSPILLEDNYWALVDNEYNRDWMRDETDDQGLFTRALKKPAGEGWSA